jgi:hypothetical protein
MSLLRTIRRRAFPAAELLAGMGLAQAIATFQVYASNRELWDRMAAVAAAGFLPVPNEHAMPALLRWETAACGGLLFTLSVGAALALLAVLAAWAFRRPGLRVGLPLGFLAGLLVLMNSRGFDPWVSLYFVLIPPVVFRMARGVLSDAERPPVQRSLGLRLLALLVVAAGWAGQYDHNLFIDLRDHVLMSNAPGRAVSDFYYRYTLYPAEVFKSLDQKLLRTVAVSPDAPRPAHLEQVLARNDYLPVASAATADVDVHAVGDRVVFSRSEHAWLDIPLARFAADPRAALSEVSTRADRWGPFRGFTFYAVLLAFPTALFLLLAAGVRLAASPLVRGTGGEILCLAVCVLAGLAILAHLHVNRVAPPAVEALERALGSDTWTERVAALKVVRERKIDLFALAGAPGLAGSPHVPERYWLARALGVSPAPRASALLLGLLKDPSLNVRTMALESLGQRRERAAIGPILEFLKGSHEWYEQMYAYQALRALGWNQVRSR